MKKILFLFVAFFIYYGCGLYETPEHENIHDPDTKNTLPLNVIFDYTGIFEVTQTEITLKWTANSDIDFERYEIYRSIQSDFSNAILITTIYNQNNSTFKDTGLSLGTLYYYKIRVYDKGGLFNETSAVKCLTAPDIENAGALIVVTTSGFYTGDQYLLDVAVDDENDLIFVSGRGRDIFNSNDGYFVRKIDAGVGSALYINGIVGISSADNVLLDSTGSSAISAGYSIAPYWDGSDYYLCVTDFFDGVIYISALTTLNLVSQATPANVFPEFQLSSSLGKSFIYIADWQGLLFAVTPAGDFYWYDTSWNHEMNIYTETNEGIDLPYGIDADENNLYFTGWASHKVAKFDDVNWQLQWVAGGSGSSNLQFSNPTGIAVDDETGYIYVSDTGNHRIQVLDTDGNFIGKWGTYGTGISEFNEPRGMDFINYGNGEKYLLIAERTTVKIYKIK